jgi:hypothetical protein
VGGIQRVEDIVIIYQFEDFGGRFYEKEDYVIKEPPKFKTPSPTATL